MSSKLNGKNKLELHVHTKFSHDSMLSFPLLYFTCRIHGITQIAITDHNTIDGAVEFKKFCQRKGEKVHVIIGEEIMTTAGEIIGLFLTDNIPGGLSAIDTVGEIKKQNGVVYIPHPYDEKRKKTVIKEEALNEIIDFVDCIEIHNGRNTEAVFSVEQEKIAERYTLKKVIGSDAHTAMEIGRNYIEYCGDVISTPEEFLLAMPIMKFHRKKCIKFSHRMTQIVRIMVMLRRKEFSLLISKLNKGRKSE